MIDEIICCGCFIVLGLVWVFLLSCLGFFQSFESSARPDNRSKIHMLENMFEVALSFHPQYFLPFSASKSRAMGKGF